MNHLIEIDVAHLTPIVPTFRTAQVAGMFDLPPNKNSVERFHAQIPDPESDWQIGLIVGPSGSGKSSIARKAFSTDLYNPENVRWHPDQAIIDNYPQQLSIKQITSTLTAVGFSSPLSWLKPYHVLSGGERFRADLARALLTETDNNMTLFDEFTSVVDRTVAKIASAALAKGIRKNRFAVRKFIAVSCHYDIIPWLTPDWILDTATFELARGRLHCRPPIDLTLHPAVRSLWRRFERHHYLTSALSKSARCYVARWINEPVCFVATLPAMGRRGHRRIHRIVTLPDFQGVGIGSAVLEAVCDEEVLDDYTVSITTSHPALISYCHQSPKWWTRAFAPLGYRANAKNRKKRLKTSAGRPVASFEYRPRQEVASEELLVTSGLATSN